MTITWPICGVLSVAIICLTILIMYVHAKRQEAFGQRDRESLQYALKAAIVEAIEVTRKIGEKK